MVFCQNSQSPARRRLCGGTGDFAIIHAMTGLALLAVALTNLTGVVTFEREGLPFFFMDEPAGVHWRVQADVGGAKVRAGDLIAVRGEREMTSKHRIAEAQVTVSGHDEASVPPPLEIGIAALFQRLLPFGNTDLYGGMVVTEGLLRDINRRQTTTQLLVGEGDCNLQVEIPWALEDALPSELVQGATVRVRGILTYTSIENYEEGVFGRIENIELIPPSPSAVEVIRRAPLLTRGRLLVALAWLAVLFGALSVWTLTLRRMVAKRSAELAESIRQRERAGIEADAARRERLRLAADLHDGFQQYLAGAMFRLKAAMNYLPAEAEACRAQLEKVNDALKHTQSGLRSTLWAMNEESVGPESLIELIHFVSRRLPHWEGIVEIASEGTERKIAHNYAGTLLLILQEAVGNAINHGHARHVKVRIVFGEKGLAMSVADDGAGFDPTTARKNGHYGLSGMERRTAELGGKITISSEVGRGSVVRFSLPL